jgi:hypothetical protein
MDSAPLSPIWLSIEKEAQHKITKQYFQETNVEE